MVLIMIFEDSRSRFCFVFLLDSYARGQNEFPTCEICKAVSSGG